jgi:hypothetical protein
MLLANSYMSSLEPQPEVWREFSGGDLNSKPKPRGGAMQFFSHAGPGLDATIAGQGTANERQTEPNERVVCWG